MSAKSSDSEGLNTSAFNGSTQEATLATTSAIEAASDLSYFCWVNKSVSVADNIASKWQSGGNLRSWYFHFPGSGKLQAVISADGSASTVLDGTVGITFNAWHNVGIVYNGATLKIYVDGAEYASTAAVIGSLFNTSADLTIGTLNGGSHFGGEMYQPMLSKSEVTSAEASEIYNSGTALCFENMSSGLRAKFNSGNGAVWRLGNYASNAGDELLDITDGSNNLTNVNSFPFTGSGLNIDC